MLSSEWEFLGSGSEHGGDGHHIQEWWIGGGLSKSIGGLGAGIKGDGDRTERSGGGIW